MKSVKVLLTVGLLCGSLNTVSLAQEENVAPATAEVTVSVDNTPATADKSPEVAEVRFVDEETVSGSTLAGPQSYSIQIQSSAVAGGDAGDEPQVKVGGTVIVIGPDGVKKVFNIDGKEGHAFKIHQNGDSGQTLNNLHDVLIMKEHGLAVSDGTESPAATEEERYVIGVQCDEAGEVLRSHLHLGNTGLIVIEVREDTPAAAAGLMKNDIIVRIDEKDLTSRDDLVSAVIGSEGKMLALSVIREGETRSINVEPRKIKVRVIVAAAGAESGDSVEATHGVNSDELSLPGLENLPEAIRKQLHEGKGSIRLQRIHPGVMLEEGVPQDEASLNRMIERFRKSAGEEAAKALTEARDARKSAVEYQKDAAVSTTHLDESVRSLRKQMEAMKQQMEALQRQLEAKNAEKE